MNVYDISSLGRPTSGGFYYYSQLLASSAIWDFVDPDGDGFGGVPFRRKWKIPTCYLEKPLIPVPNFLNFSGSVLVCDQSARELAGEALEMSCEFLPIKIEKVKGEFWICNITNTINVVDSEKSQWENLGKDESGQLMRRLIRPAFVAERFGEESLFKVPEDRGAGIYCLERTGDPDDGEFKAVVEKHGLTGLAFELIWTDERRASRK